MDSSSLDGSCCGVIGVDFVLSRSSSNLTGEETSSLCGEAGCSMLEPCVLFSLIAGAVSACLVSVISGAVAMS